MHLEAGMVALQAGTGRDVAEAEAEPDPAARGGWLSRLRGAPAEPPPAAEPALAPEPEPPATVNVGTEP
jgi:hypothetical protein